MNEPTIEDIRTLCTNIGAALLGCQTAEKLINHTLQWLFPKEPNHTVEMFEHLEEQLRRKTLGQFIHTLRERVGLAADFDMLLTDFLDHRNTLVHDLQRVPGHTFGTIDGIHSINAYVLRVGREAQRITEIFAALIDTWTEQVGMRDGLRAAEPNTYDSEFFTQIRATISPILDDLVFQKESV